MTEYDKYNLVAYSGEAEIRRQTFDELLGQRLVEDGYVLLGTSSFNGPMESEQSLTSQAKRIGAELVIATNAYTDTAAGAVPVTTYSPQTYSTSGSMYSSGGGWATYSGTTTGTVANTTMMPYSVRRYDQSASYWTRTARPRVFGAMVDEMTAEDRRQLGANQGVKLVAAQRGGAAWNANLLPGDVIVSVNGQTVSSKGQFQEIVGRAAGNRVQMSIARGSERREVSVDLNPDPMVIRPEPLR